jgi:hypothetical protein
MFVGGFSHLIIYMYPLAWWQKPMPRHRNRGLANLRKNIDSGERGSVFIANRGVTLH